MYDLGFHGAAFTNSNPRPTHLDDALTVRGEVEVAPLRCRIAYRRRPSALSGSSAAISRTASATAR